MEQEVEDQNSKCKTEHEFKVWTVNSTKIENEV